MSSKIPGISECWDTCAEPPIPHLGQPRHWRHPIFLHTVHILTPGFTWLHVFPIASTGGITNSKTSESLIGTITEVYLMTASICRGECSITILLPSKYPQLKSLLPLYRSDEHPGCTQLFTCCVCTQVTQHK